MTNIHPTLFNATKPLLDRSNTPRGALKSITLERNFTNKKWLYAKNSCDEFDPRLSRIDLKKGKDLMKLTKKEDRVKVRRSIADNAM